MSENTGAVSFVGGSLGPFRRLLAWRLRFYAEVTVKLLVRRWQMLLLTTLILSPASMPLAAQIQVLASPVDRLLAGADAAAIWIGFAGLAFAWSSLQGSALSGAEHWRYLSTQTGIRRWESGVDLAVLTIADLPLLLPFAAHQIELRISPSDLPFQAALAAGLALQLPLMQQRLLRGRNLAAWSIFVLSLATVQSIAAGLPAAVGLLNLIAGPLAADRFAAFLSAALRPARREIGWKRPALSSESAARNLLKLNLRALLQPGVLLARLPLLAYAGAIVWFGDHWRPLGLHDSVALWLLLASMVPLLWQCAGLMLILRRARLPMLPVLTSLGIRPRQLLLADLAVVQAVFLVLEPAALAMLLPILGPRAGILPILGAVALTGLACLYANSAAHRPPLLSKLFAAAIFLAGARLWVIGDSII